MGQPIACNVAREGSQTQKTLDIIKDVEYVYIVGISKSRKSYTAQRWNVPAITTLTIPYLRVLAKDRKLAIPKAADISGNTEWDRSPPSTHSDARYLRKEPTLYIGINPSSFSSVP